MSATKVVTGLVRFSYANVWEPRAIQEGQTPKYSCAILIPKEDTKTIEKIKAAIEAAKQLGVEKFGAGFSKGGKYPLKDGDEETDDDGNLDPNYVGHMFLNATSFNRPGIVDANANPLTEQGDFYSGCYGHASINFYPYKKAGNKGVSPGLNNLMKRKDGEKLSGKADASSDFADLVESTDSEII